MAQVKVTNGNIHDLINVWHKGNSTQELHEYLGLTFEQYAHWVETDELPAEEVEGEDFREVIEKMIKMSLKEAFCFVVRDNDTEDEYHIGVKLIEEFSSLLLIVGHHGGGFNMVFSANDNMVNREANLQEWIKEEFTKEFSGYKFIRFCVNGE